VNDEEEALFFSRRKELDLEVASIRSGLSRLDRPVEDQSQSRYGLPTTIPSMELSMITDPNYRQSALRGNSRGVASAHQRGRAESTSDSVLSFGNLGVHVCRHE
jgi:hypothetical protein